MRKEVAESSLDQGIEFEVMLIRIEDRSLMKVSADTHVEAAFERDIGCLARLFAETQVLVDSVPEVLLQ